MLDAMFGRPEHAKSGKLVVTDGVVERTESLFPRKTKRRRESA